MENAKTKSQRKSPYESSFLEILSDYRRICNEYKDVIEQMTYITRLNDRKEYQKKLDRLENQLTIRQNHMLTLLYR